MIADRILAIIALLGLAVFMVIPAIRIPTPDIIAVVILCLAFAATDFFLATRKRPNGGDSGPRS